MTFRDRYFCKLRIDPKLEKQKVETALKRAYEQRKFEIEHYWKRATYFWGFQVAIFATFGLVWKDDGTTHAPGLLLALASIGLATAIANAFSARGSKFWQENWEKHIDMLEDEIEGRLHKMVWLDEGDMSFSVSGVNQALNDCFVAFWLFATIYCASQLVDPVAFEGTSFFLKENVFFTPSVVLFFALSWLWRRTNIKGMLSRPNEDVPWRGQRNPPIGLFVTRFPPDDRNAKGSGDRSNVE